MAPKELTKREGGLENEGVILAGGKSRVKKDTKSIISLEELTKHRVLGRNADDSDLWLSYRGKVYDVSEWAFTHPGGRHVVHSCCGKDATVAIKSFHPDMAKTLNLMKPMQIGVLDAEHGGISEMDRDILDLGESFRKQGLYRPNPFFFVAQILHTLLMEVLAWYLIYQFGTGWLPFIGAAVLFASAQALLGWAQHDYGHLSVFKSTTVNRWAHLFVIGTLKGASASWWQWRHNRHHVATNVTHVRAKSTVVEKSSNPENKTMKKSRRFRPSLMSVDPDVTMPQAFVLGKEQPVGWAQRMAQSGRKTMPYHLQHLYWFLVPPLLLITYIFQQNVKFMIVKRAYRDMIAIGSFLAIFFGAFVPLLGVGNSFLLYFFMRSLESHWFTWVTQSNHLPMEIGDSHRDKSWLELHTRTTCNIEQGYFNDWFTGHLNFQIEHHLFPTMPRCNYAVASVEVKRLCEKHNIKYVTKSLWQSFADIVHSLKTSGAIYQQSLEEIYGVG